MEDNAWPPGVLIAVEGIDGAGKTTQVDRLCAALEAAGEKVVRSKEPTNGPHGRRLRESAHNGRMDAHDELATFIADRREHVEKVIRPNLSDGRVVILDRYFYSTIAYQGARTGHNPCDFYRDMMEFPTPDVTFLIDVPAEVGLQRIAQSRGDIPNQFERLDSLQAIRSRFLQLLDCASEVQRIDGLPDIDTVYQDVIHKLVDVLKNKRCVKSWDCDMFYCSYRITGQCTWPQERYKLVGS